MYTFETPAFCRSEEDCVLDLRTYTRTNDVQTRMVKAESFEGTQFLDGVKLTNFDPKFHDRYWRIEDIHLIQNNKLYGQYEEFRKELSGLGRTAESIQDTLLFSVETEKSCKDICRDGYKVGSKRRHVLGHTGSGVHLVQHYDILTRYLTYQQYASPTYVLVFKSFLGKQKPIVPRLHRDDNFVSPNAGFDCHVSARQVDKRMTICEALNCSYVYLYEFDDVASNTVKYPRQILPCAILQLVKKKIPIMNESPFLAVGSSDCTSTWEVKGETRRGFRFMFSKSGLKGRHKVFAKDIPSAPIESYLKGQILEMRTKSPKKTSDETPPTLQRIDDVDDSHHNACATKPPSLQKVLTKQPTSSTHGHVIPATITKPFGPSLSNAVSFPYMHAYPQLSMKPIVKLKRLRQGIRRSYTKSLSHRSSVTGDGECKESDQSKTKNKADMTSGKSELLRLLQSENPIVAKYTIQIKDCDGIKAKPRCETRAISRAFHKLNKTKIQYGVKTNGQNTTLHKKKNIFKPCIMKRRYKVKPSEATKSKYCAENVCKIKKRSIKKKSNVQEYAVEVNGDTHIDDTCSSIKVKFTRKSVDDDCTSKEIPNNQLNVSMSSSETVVAQKELKSTQENNSDVSYTSATENEYQPPLSTYSPHSMSNPLSSARTSQCSMNSNQVIIEKSKSPVIANAAPDMLNITPELASAQIYICSDKVGNSCDSIETAVKNCDKIPVDVNESNLADQPYVQMSQSKKTTTDGPLVKLTPETEKDYPVVTKHSCAVLKVSAVLPNIPKELNDKVYLSDDSRREISAGSSKDLPPKHSCNTNVKLSDVSDSSNNVSSVQTISSSELQKPQSDNKSNPSVNSPVGCQPEDQLVSVDKMKEDMVTKRIEKAPDDKLKLLQAYTECIGSSQPNDSLAANCSNPSNGNTAVELIKSTPEQSHSSTKHVKVPTTFVNATLSTSDTIKTASTSSIASSAHRDIESNTKLTESIKSGRMCSVPNDDEIKTNLKVDTLTATRLRSFLGSTAAAALKHRKSVNDKKTASNYNSVTSTFTDIRQLALNKTERPLESNSLSIPEIQKERTFVSPKLPIGTDSTDDNDSQDTVIGGLSLSPARRFTPEPISLHELHSNVRIDFDHSFTPSTYQKESESRAPVVKIERDDPYVPVCPQSAIDSLSTKNDRVPEKRSCNMHSVKEETSEADSECNSSLPETTGDTQTLQSESEPNPPIFPRTQQELARGASVLNASQSKSAIVDTLKQLSTVLKYLTENSGQSKRDVSFVAEKMCKTLSSVPSKTRNVSSCSEVSSSVQDEMLTNTQQHVVKIKQEPQDEHEYVSSISQTPSIEKTAQPSTNYKSVEFSIKKEIPDTSILPEMSSDINPYLQQSSSADECRKNVDTTTSERTTKHALTAEKKSRLNEVWNKCVFHDEGDLAQPPFIPCTNAPDKLHYSLYPSEESDILPFETFGNLHELSFTKRKQTHMKRSSLNYLDQCARKEPTSDTSQQKPKSSSLTIKSGVLNKGLKFNSLRRRRQTKTLIVKQFPSIPSDADNDAITDSQAVTIKTENTTDQESLHSTESSGLAEKTGEVNHAQVYLTVCQKLEQLKEYGNEGYNEQPNSKQDQDEESSIVSSMAGTLHNAPIATLDNVSSTDTTACSEQTTLNNVQSDVELSQVAIPKDNDKGQHGRDEKAKKKVSDVIPFHTVIRLKKLQYMRFKRGESQKKFIDYRDVFSKLSYRNRSYRNYRSRTSTNKSPEEDKKSVISDVKVEPLKPQDKTGLVKNNDNLGKKLNYFIPKFKNSAISKRGTALIEDKFRDPTVQIGSLTSNTTTTRISAEKEAQVHTSETSTKERRSQSHKRDSIEHKTDSRSHSHRSRSKSSHRSQKSDQSRKRKSTHSPIAPDNKRKLVDKHYDCRPAGSHSSQPFDHKRANSFRFTRYQPSYKSTPYFGKSSFSRSGTGYFSWRRKYQPNPIRRNAQEDVIVTATGKVLSKSEYIEWTKFKQREDLRMQIESAIKEYRNTFEFTADDQRGDQKVASYLHLLTDKLDVIQNKRDKVKPTSVKSETTEKMENHSHEKDEDTQQPKRRAKHLIDKLERSKSFNSNVSQHHSSISKFSNTLASDSNKFSYKQRQYVGGIETILKQHLEKHCEYITKQIKQEITDEIEELQSKDNVKADENKFKYKTKKPYRDFKEKYYKPHHTDKGNGFDRHGSSRSRERDETDSRCSSEKKGEHDVKYDRGGRDRYGEPRPSSSYFYKDKYDLSTKYGSSHKYSTKKENYSSYKRDTYKGQHTHHAGKPDSFDKYDFQQNFDRYQKKGTDKYKEFRPYKYKPWFQGKYDKSSWYQHKEKPDFSKSDRDYHPRFKKDKQLDDIDEFNAARYSKYTNVPFRGRGRGRGFFRGRPSYHARYQPAKYSTQNHETNYHKSSAKKRGSSKGYKNKFGSRPNSSSKYKDTVSTEIVIEENTEEEGPKPIPTICGRRS